MKKNNKNLARLARGNAYAGATHESQVFRLRKSMCFLQDDQALANAPGATFRADANANLQALVTLSSGTSAPATTWAYQLWADTTNNLLKQRNAANSGWLVRGTLAETFVLSRSSNTILGVSDYARNFNCTTTFTQTFTAAATLLDGWWCEIRNDGTGVITLDPNGAETIDGFATLDLNPGQSCIVTCNGSAFKTCGLNGSRVGEVVFWPGLVLPGTALECDGSARSRTTYAAVFNKLVKSNTVTMTLATPGVVTWNSHGLSNYFPIKFTTSGALPTGVTAGQTYWTKNVSTNTFEFSLLPGGVSINTSVSQSGTHTGICAVYGDGDGSTTFNLPNFQGAAPIGYGAGTVVDSCLAASISTGSDTFTFGDNAIKWITGMPVVLTTSGGAPAGLVAGTTYYIIRDTSGTVKLASTLENAQNGTAIDITTQGTGTHTLTHSRDIRGLGEAGGEQYHAMSAAELLKHRHGMNFYNNPGANAGQLAGGGANSGVNATDITTTGGNQAMNVMNPFAAGRWIIYFQ